MGFGPAAHSFSGCRRYWNVRDIKVYLERIHAGELPVEAEEIITGSRRMIEAIYLGLRLTDGFSIAGFESLFQIDFASRFGGVASFFASRGLLSLDSGRCRLTPKGIRFADGIASRFIQEI